MDISSSWHPIPPLGTSTSGKAIGSNPPLSSVGEDYYIEAQNTKIRTALDGEKSPLINSLRNSFPLLRGSFLLLEAL